MPGNGWFQVSRPETRWVFETLPSASTVQTRWADFEYTTRRPVPESAGSTQAGGSVVVVGGGASVSVTCAWVPRDGVAGDGVATSDGGAIVVVVVVVVVIEVVVVVTG